MDKLQIITSVIFAITIIFVIIRKIDTVVGMRRSGKTWFLYQVMADLLAKGEPKEPDYAALDRLADEILTKHKENGITN